MILETPASRYFHLEACQPYKIYLILPGQDAHVASKSSRLGTGGIEMMGLVATDMVGDVVNRSGLAWREGIDL